MGEGLRQSEIDRSQVFIETKIWISDYGEDETLHGFEKSAAKLGVDQIDLLILHQPLGTAFDKTLAAYKSLETLLDAGKVRAMGVSIFMPRQLEQLLAKTDVVPAVNQIELHPYFQQKELQVMNRGHGILSQAWSPIGGITFYMGDTPKSTLTDPTIEEIARRHDKTPAQIMLRWHLQEGRSVIPKSVKPARIAENSTCSTLNLPSRTCRPCARSTPISVVARIRTPWIWPTMACRSRKHNQPGPG